MKIAELRQKAKGELEKILADSRERLSQLRFDLAAGKVKNVREIRKIASRFKRKIATVTL